MKTRILNISPKVQLDIDDNKQGSYPTVLRSGDERSLGNSTIKFDDVSTQRFVSQTVLMPYNVNSSIASQSGFLTGTIQITKTPNPSTQFLTKYEDESYAPYDESRNPAPFFTLAQKAGTPSSTYPGFSSEIVDKVMIPIDITSKQHKDSFKMVSSLATGPSYQNGTGFMYYNFGLKEWQDIGLVDQALGNATGYDVVFTQNNSVLLPSSKEKYLCQFTPSPGVASSLALPTSASLLNIGYDKIGAPTAFFDAPNAPRYHATSSQTLKLSAYIQHPFVLEKIYVEMPIAGVRGQDPSGFPVKPGAYHDITNHVLFIYKQNRSCGTIDTVADVSSSLRSLVANSSFCFYNENSIYAPFSTPKILHNPDFYIDHNMPTGSVSRSVITASYKAHFTPRIYDELRTAISQYPQGTNNLSFGVSHFWPGGTRNNISGSILKFETSPPVSDVVNYNDTATPKIFNPIVDKRGKRYSIDPRTLVSSVWRSDNSLTRNAFYSGSFIGGNPQFDVGATTNTADFSRQTPYLLFPEDELIVGIDSGFYAIVSSSAVGDMVPSFSEYHEILGAHSSAASLTGSILSILPGPAKICLYGSLIKDNVAKPYELNQNLTSNSIHEVIQNTIVDQFDISERSLYSGSYLGNYIVGSTSLDTDPPRRVTARASSTNVYPNFALNRFSTMRSISSTFVNADRAVPIANFRYDHFGFYSDILEQSHDSARIDVSFVQKQSGQINFNKVTSTSLVDAPAICMFVSQSSETIIPARFTRSSNLSNAFTCSLPFYDNTARNRSTITFGENAPFNPSTIIINKPSSLLSTT